MPALVEAVKLTAFPIALDSDTVKVMVLVPELPSVTLALLIEMLASVLVDTRATKASCEPALLACAALSTGKFEDEL